MRLPLPFISPNLSRPRFFTATGIVLLCLMLALPSFGSAAPAAKPSTSSSQATGQTAGQTAAAGKPTQNSGPSTEKPTAQPAQQATESVPPQMEQSTHSVDAPVAPPLPEPHSQTAPKVPNPATSATGTAAANATSAALPSGPALIARPGGLPLPSFLQKLLDPKGSLTVSDVTGAGQTFQPFENASASLFSKLRQTPGTVWLRFTMAPSRLPVADGGNNDGLELALLDLGDQISASPQVWTRPGGKGAPREVKPGESGLYPLTSLSGGGEVLVRLTGQPGLWFAPSLRSLSDALGSPERRLHPLTLAALTVLLMLCIVRSITERGDGRIWAAIFAGAALLQAFCGVPATPDGSVRPLDMPGLLAAGVALMLLPHVGRNIMRTREISPETDVLLLILALPGAALALLPLLPGQAWMARLLALWPLGAALPLLPALYLLTRGTPGSGLFSLACLAMTGGSLAALWGISGVYAPLWGQGPLLGVTLATLLLAAAPRSAYGETRLPVRPREEIHSLNFPLNIDPEPAILTTQKGLDSALKLEEALRSPLDALLREACALDQVLGGSQEPRRDSLSTGRPFAPSLADKLPPPPLNEHDARQARRHADNMVAASRELSALVTDIPRTAMHARRQAGGRRTFELRRLVTDSFTTVRDEAENKGLGLSWYVAPHLNNLYRGDSDRLRFILSMLLADAVRATERGVVSLRVRRGDMSTNPGHLQFTVADTGEGTPPLRRSSLLVARAWELAADHRGELFVDGTPCGVDVTFSMDCTALTDDGTGELPRPPENIPERGANPVPHPCLVILASDIPLNRQILAWHLEGQGQDVWEARDTEEAIALYSHTPAALVIFDGHLPEDGVVTAIAGIRVFEGEHMLPAVSFLSLSVDDAQAERLHQAGCDHSLPLPVVRGEFRAMALHLASISAVKPQPSLAPRRVPFLAAQPSHVKNELLADRVHTLRVQPPQRVHASSPNSQAPKRENAPLDFAPARPLASSTVGNPQPVGKKMENATGDLDPVAPKAELAAGIFDPTAGKTKPATIKPATAKPPVLLARPEAPAGAPELRPSLSLAMDKSTAPTPKTDAASALVAEASQYSTVSAASPLKTGLNIPPSPPKKRGWLTSLLKPVPYIAPMPDAELDEKIRVRGGEWVGNPMPILVPVSLSPDITKNGPPSVVNTTSDETVTTFSSMTIPTTLAEPLPLAFSDATPNSAEAAPVDFAEVPVTPLTHTSLEIPAENATGEIAAEISPKISKPLAAIFTEPPTVNLAKIPAAEAHTTELPEIPAMDLADLSAVPLEIKLFKIAAPDEEKIQDARQLSFLPEPPPQPALQPEVSPSLPPDLLQGESDSISSEQLSQSSAKSRRKSRIEELPFLTLDPNYMPPGSEADETVGELPLSLSLHAPGQGLKPLEAAPARPITPAPFDEDIIVELTEAEMVDSPLLQQAPDLLISLDSALERAELALDKQDPRGLANAAGRMADRAAAFGLHGLSDLAQCLREAAENDDFETAAQLLPDLRTEIARQRGK